MAQAFFLNWSTRGVDITLNGTLVKSGLEPPDPKYDDVPFRFRVERDVTGSDQPGVWGRSNQLILQFDGTSTPVRYTPIDDPGGDPSADLYIWLFADSVVFSQFNETLSEGVTPSGTASSVDRTTRSPA